MMEKLETIHIQIALSIVSIGGYFILKGVVRRIINTYLEKHDYKKSTYAYINKVFYSLTFLVILGVNFIIWNVSIKGLSVYFASFFTLFGIAFFASWSILSNITASVILLLDKHMKIGHRIRIHEGVDTSVEGVIKDFGLFNFQVELDNGNILNYPNNLALQKAISLIHEQLDSESLEEEN